MESLITARCVFWIPLGVSQPSDLSLSDDSLRRKHSQPRLQGAVEHSCSLLGPPPMLLFQAVSFPSLAISDYLAPTPCVPKAYLRLSQVDLDLCLLCHTEECREGMTGLDVELAIRVGGKRVAAVHRFSSTEPCRRGMALFGMSKATAEKGGGQACC